MVIPEKCHSYTRDGPHEKLNVWWPGISRDIESTVRVSTSVPPEDHYNHGHDLQDHLGKMILVLINAQSKWIEATLHCYLNSCDRDVSLKRL